MITISKGKSRLYNSHTMFQEGNLYSIIKPNFIQSKPYARIKLQSEGQLFKIQFKKGDQ